MPNDRYAIAAGLPVIKLRHRVAQRRQQTFRSYADDPVRFIREVLGEPIWSKQREIAEAVRDHRRVAVHTAHSVGKSFIAARIIAWWISQRPDPFVVTTAPSGPQLKAILWREIGRAFARGKLPGRVNQTEWYAPNESGREELVAYGRKPSDYDQAAFQGIHAASVLVVLDESSGVPESLFIAADTLTSGGDSRTLAIGNPDDPSSHFAKICKPGSGWHVIHIDGLQSPNFTDEDVPGSLQAVLLSPEWVEEKKLEWGESSPIYTARVNGLFPEDASDGIIKLSWVMKCKVEREDSESPDLIELGCDIGAGGDFTVVRERRGMKAGRAWRKLTPDPEQAVSLIMDAINETSATCIKVDSIGIGWGIAGRLEEIGREGGHKARIVRVNASEASTEKHRFHNLRDQMWWMGRTLSQEVAWDLSAVDDNTIAQLIAPKYSSASGRTKVEPKADTIKRIGHSPDDADALLLAFFDGGKRSIKVF